MAEMYWVWIGTTRVQMKTSACYLLTDFLLKLWILHKFADNFLNCRINPVLIPLSFISTAVSVHKLPVFAGIIKIIFIIASIRMLLAIYIAIHTAVLIKDSGMRTGLMQQLRKLSANL